MILPSISRPHKDRVGPLGAVEPRSRPWPGETGGLCQIKQPTRKFITYSGRSGVGRLRLYTTWSPGERFACIVHPFLSEASAKGHKHVVEMLLIRGADVNIQSHTTPLQAAAQAGHEEIITLLLDKGASLLQPPMMPQLVAMKRLWSFCCKLVPTRT